MYIGHDTAPLFWLTVPKQSDLGYLVPARSLLLPHDSIVNNAVNPIVTFISSGAVSTRVASFGAGS